VDAIFKLSKAYPLQSVGSVKDVVHLDQNSSKMLEVIKGPRSDKILHFIL